MDVSLRPYSKKFNHSYVWGVYPVLELLKNKPGNTLKVILSPRGKSNRGVSEILDICKRKNIKIEWSDGLILKTGGSENSFAVGVFEKYKDSIQDSNHLVLVNPSDAGNLGTILRTCLGFGVSNLAIILPAVDLFDPKVVRASMGAIFKVKVECFGSFEEYQTKFKRKNYLFMLNGESRLSQVTFESKCSLVFGNEGAGLENALRKYGETVTIEQSKEIDSLNLSISVGVALHKLFID